MTDSVLTAVTAIAGQSGLDIHALTLTQLIHAVRHAHPSTVWLVSPYQGVPKIVSGTLRSVSFDVDPYSTGTVFSGIPIDSTAQLQSAWSPTEPLYYLDGASPPWIFCHDLSILQELSDALTVPQELDERFALWTLTGLPAGQFGLSPMRTPWLHIKQVPAGIVVAIDIEAERLRFDRAPQPLWNTEQVSTRHACDRIAEAFADSVSRCTSTPAAVLASGGIDSSAVVGASSAIGRRPHLFTNIYPAAPETNEETYVNALRETYRLPVLPITSQPASLFAYAQRQSRPFRGLFRADDQLVIEQAHALGLEVILDGLGGDELFAVRDYPIGRLSHSANARALLPAHTWSQIYGKHHPNMPDDPLLPPFVTGIDEQELLWEFKFRPLLEMDCPDRVLRRVYSLMFESNFWEEAQWLSREVFEPQGIKRRHPFISIDVLSATLSAPQRTFRRTPVTKPLQRRALRKYLPTPIATRYGGAEQTANVMLNLQHSHDDIIDTLTTSALRSSNAHIDGDQLDHYYQTGLAPASSYEGGPINFDHFWSALCYDRWAAQWGIPA